jgi:GGDEF domain-containing protein
MSPDARSTPNAIDPLTGFGSRAALMVHLAAAVDPRSGPTAIAVFGLDGLDELEHVYGASKANDVIVRLAEEFARMVRPPGFCYAPRRREFCVVFDLPLAAVTPIVAAASIALRREGAMARITTPFGIAVLPDQADDPIGALRVADRNLNEARRAQRRKRPVPGQTF